MLEGQTSGTLDEQVLRDTIQDCAEEFTPDAKMTIDYYVDDNGNAKENHFLVMSDFVTFE